MIINRTLPLLIDIAAASASHCALLLFGATAVVMTGSMLTAYVVEGDLKAGFRRRRMQRRIDAMKAHNVKRVLNDLQFGGYLIWRQMPVYIDGRAELYGEAFGMSLVRAVQLKDANGFLNLLATHDIDAVMLDPTTPASKLLDHIAGWQRLYADDRVVVHVRAAT